ncbi:MAG: PEP-CTERM sorting domain-containing protein [Tepidisphaeraceae bacterium]
MKKMHIASVLPLLAVATSSAFAANVTTLGSFNAAVTGSTSYGTLSFDAAGNLYGTTSTGGTGGGGTIFQVTGAGVSPVVSFTGGADSGAYAGMTYDATTNTFYGTTRGNNSNATDGTVFAYTPGGSSVTTLHTFVSTASFGTEGSQLVGPVTLKNGVLYGTTQFGGSSVPSSSYGTLFTLSGTDKTTLTSLTGFAGSNGYYPTGKLSVDNAGNVFGTTIGNSSSTGSWGTAYQYSPTTATITTLTGFTRFSATGTTTRGGLVADSAGDLYGMTTVVSPFSTSPAIFKLSGADHLTVTTLATFNSATTGVPGLNYEELLMDAQGNLFGTSRTGGANNFGTVWMLAAGDTAITTLYTFTNGTDGGTPAAGLALRDGLLYGTTTTGGANGAGTVFSVAVPEPASLAVLGLGAVGLLVRRRTTKA